MRFKVYRFNAEKDRKPYFQDYEVALQSSDHKVLDALARLKEQGWEWGYGIHVNGHAIWDGVNSCYVGGMPTGQDPMVVEDLGVFCDPLEFVSSRAYRDNHPRLARALHWNVLSPVMERAIRDLRHDAARSGPLAARKSP